MAQDSTENSNIVVSLTIISTIDSYATGRIYAELGNDRRVFVDLPNVVDTSNNYMFAAGSSTSFNNMNCRLNANAPEDVLGETIIGWRMYTNVNGLMTTAKIACSGEEGAVFSDGGNYTITITAYDGVSGNNSGNSEEPSTGENSGESGGNEGSGGSSDSSENGGSSSEEGSGSSDEGDSGSSSSTDNPDYVSLEDAFIKIPVIKGTIPKELVESLKSLGYVKARAVVVFPTPQDRKVVCQGVACPTLYTKNHRGEEIGEKKTPLRDLWAQSSWFFRPKLKDTYVVREDINEPSSKDGEPIAYQDYDKQVTSNIKRTEIQGHFEDYNKFMVTWDTLTLHSPDVEFDTNLANLDYAASDLDYVKVGNTMFNRTLSDIDIQTESPAISSKGSGFEKKSFTKNFAYGIISGLFWDDYVVDDNCGEKMEKAQWFQEYSHQKASAKWMVYLWHRKGSLNNDIERPADCGVRSAMLKQKIVSNLRVSHTNYTAEVSGFNFNTKLFNSDVGDILKLKPWSNDYSNLYKGNVDTLLIPDKLDGIYFALNYSVTGSHIENMALKFEDAFSTVDYTSGVGLKTYAILNDEGAIDSGSCGIYTWNGSEWDRLKTDFGQALGDKYTDLVLRKEGVRLQYKSTPHLVLTYADGEHMYEHTEEDSLPIVEVKRRFANESILFGGISEDALKDNIWIPCGEPVRLDESEEDGSVEYEYSWGDTYFQRWDCLKTYAFTPEDINQVVEIGSFMLETHVNIDGRYDRNRGQLSNLYMSPKNFNLLNPVYSQLNNFFSYRILDKDAYNRKYYPNQITWSKTKTSGADVDLWTNVTLASVMEMDGDKGSVRKLARLNDQLICFQDKGIAQVMYNDNVQISASNGTPIEIANSGKVSGKKYFSDSVGCSNKWSIAQTPAGIYFMDSINKVVFLFNGQLNNLSGTMGFNTWAKNTIPSFDEGWNPESFEDFVSYYDKQNQDVMFINSDIALDYSEKLAAFTSFYDYGHSPYFCNLQDTGVWIRNDKRDNKQTISFWKHNAGEYCSFFGVQKPYWMTLIGNPEPQMDKIFTNLEFRACVDGDMYVKTYIDSFDDSFDGTFHPLKITQEKPIPLLPFDHLEVWDEHQHGVAVLDNKNGHDAFKHHTPNGESSLKRKFRIWRCDIPRDNWDAPENNAAQNIYRLKRHPNDRMRNPWLYLKLMKKAEEDTSHRTEIHDLLMTYFA